jgi:ABC-type transporter Mla subunit MlaD
MIEANKFRLGLFVIIGITLFFVVIFIFGLSDIFVRKGKFVSLFSESVQGVAVGSPIKYKGVPIGAVSKISIQVHDKLIRIDMDIDMKAFITDHQRGDQAVASFNEFFLNESKKGLRCRLEYAGITGLKYVELDYFDQSPLTPIIERPRYISSDYFYIPSMPSQLKDILKLINTSLEKIAKVQFDKISEEMTGTLKSTQRLFDDPKLKMTIDKLEKMSDNMEKSSSSLSKVLTESKLREIVDGLDTNLKALNELTVSAKRSIEGAKFIETAQSFREAAYSVTDARQALLNTLLKLDQSLDSLTELVNALDDDPSSLLKGKHKPVFIKPSTAQ